MALSELKRSEFRGQLWVGTRRFSGGLERTPDGAAAFSSYFPCTKLQCFFLGLCEQHFFLYLHPQENKHPQLKRFFSTMWVLRIQIFLFCGYLLEPLRDGQWQEQLLFFCFSWPELNFTAVLLWCSLCRGMYEPSWNYTLAPGRGTWRCLCFLLIADVCMWSSERCPCPQDRWPLMSLPAQTTVWFHDPAVTFTQVCVYRQIDICTHVCV